MNRFVRAASAAAILAGGLGSVGCHHTRGGGDECSAAAGAGANGRKTCGDRYDGCVDPSYPERYNYAARQAVLSPFAAQTNNGHVLTQTLYNHHFDEGSDKLNAMGVEKLNAMVRTRPGLDPRLYVQTARDIKTTPETADKLAEYRTELDARRAAAVKKYLGQQPPGAAVPYEVFVHDPVVPGIEATFAANAYRGMVAGYQGGIRGNGPGAVIGTTSGIVPLQTTQTTVTTSGGGAGGSGAATSGSGSN